MPERNVNATNFRESFESIFKIPLLDIHGQCLFDESGEFKEEFDSDCLDDENIQNKDTEKLIEYLSTEMRTKQWFEKYAMHDLNTFIEEEDEYVSK